MTDFDLQVGAAEVLGMIGARLSAKVISVQPTLKPGSHEIDALVVTTEHGRFRVTVEPVSE